MNKNNTLALYSEVAVDARELSDAELMQIQGGGGNNYNGGNFHHNNSHNHQFQRDCGDQRFGQNHYGWRSQGDRDDRRGQGDCDDRQFRPTCQNWGFQGERTPWNNCQ